MKRRKSWKNGQTDIRHLRQVRALAAQKLPHIGVAFREQFIGQGADIALTKAGGTIDALAGATITSTAVTNATATSIAAVAALG